VRAGDSLHGIHVMFNPATGHNIYDAKLLEYSSRWGQGEVKLRLDTVQDHKGGTVRGKILYAKLYGKFLELDGWGYAEPEKEKVFEIYNFPFEVSLKVWEPSE
jgi:hypothetical protein